ncbi:hypothetical protein FRC07_001511 [Ceratobasidium sp. 392]|nr:hypothetical protein FRC07_001511 [Ceratobasidium sp. 392]
MPINGSRMIRYEFSRCYTLSSNVNSYLEEINNWAQFVQVQPVDWKIGPVNEDDPRAGFYAIPKFPDCKGRAHQECSAWAPSRDEAREHASQLLFQQAQIDANALNVRWRFSESRTSRGTIQYATPIVYGPNILWNEPSVIGYGVSHRRAKDQSARKLLEHGYCMV